MVPLEVVAVAGAAHAAVEEVLAPAHSADATVTAVELLLAQLVRAVVVVGK